MTTKGKFAEMDEKCFTEQVVMPLLLQMGFQDVRNN
jgi:hypothetical protein